MKSKTLCSVKYLFDGLDDQTSTECLALCRSRSFAKGEVLSAQGDRFSCLLILASGEVVRQKYTTGGEYSTLDILEAGEVVGIEYLSREVKHFSYEIEAISAGSVYSLSKENMQELMRQYPQIVMNVQKLMSEQICRQDIHVDILSQKSVRKKIAAYILSKTNPDGISEVCRMPASRETLARYLALPRQSLARELRAMTDEEMILVHARYVTVLDRDALIRLIDET